MWPHERDAKCTKAQRKAFCKSLHIETIQTKVQNRRSDPQIKAKKLYLILKLTFLLRMKGFRENILFEGRIE